jgi:hypothetical protein
MPAPSRYPLRIEDRAGATFLGGRFVGEVPLESVGEHTHCNSAAVAVRRSGGVRVAGIRARRVRDGIRFSSGAYPFVLEKAWLSDVRDDCVENNFLSSGIIRDVHFDGCFVGISAKVPSGRTADGSAETVILEGVLMRLQPFPIQGGVSQGSPLKVGDLSPSFRLYGSVFVPTMIRNHTRSPVTWSPLFAWGSGSARRRLGRVGRWHDVRRGSVADDLLIGGPSASIPQGGDVDDVLSVPAAAISDAKRGGFGSANEPTYCW